jgi:hypothetical protein
MYCTVHCVSEKDEAAPKGLAIEKEFSVMGRLVFQCPKRQVPFESHLTASADDAKHFPQVTITVYCHACGEKHQFGLQEATFRDPPTDGA